MVVTIIAAGVLIKSSVGRRKPAPVEISRPVASSDGKGYHEHGPPPSHRTGLGCISIVFSQMCEIQPDPSDSHSSSGKQHNHTNVNVFRACMLFKSNRATHGLLCGALRRTVVLGTVALPIRSSSSILSEYNCLRLSVWTHSGGYAFDSGVSQIGERVSIDIDAKYKFSGWIHMVKPVRHISCQVLRTIALRRIVTFSLSCRFFALARS